MKSVETKFSSVSPRQTRGAVGGIDVLDLVVVDVHFVDTDDNLLATQQIDQTGVPTLPRCSQRRPDRHGCGWEGGDSVRARSREQSGTVAGTETWPIRPLSLATM